MEFVIQFAAALSFGLLGAGAEFGLRRYRAIRSDREAHDQYPVAGAYITYFEDVVDGETVRAKAPLTLEQQGWSVRGKTQASRDGREWQLEGRILNGGYVSGHYFRSSPHDPGRGTFFVEPLAEQAGDYRGLWGGFDSANRRIMSGGYSWHRRPEVEIEPLTSGSPYEAAGLALLSDALGRRFITRDEYGSYIGQEQGRYALCAATGQKLVAVRLTKVLDQEEKQQIEVDFAHRDVRIDLSGHKTGLLKSSAVREEFRGRGIGGQLNTTALSWLREQGCTNVVAVSWVSGADQSSEPVLKRSGFTEVGRVERFWFDDSEQGDYDCPACGRPCTCAAILFSRLL